MSSVDRLLDLFNRLETAEFFVRHFQGERDRAFAERDEALAQLKGPSRKEVSSPRYKSVMEGAEIFIDSCRRLANEKDERVRTEERERIIDFLSTSTSYSMVRFTAEGDLGAESMTHHEIRAALVNP